MSYVQVRDDIDLYEYYVLLAKSLEADEREQYNLATLVAVGVNAPKRLKRWKWRYSDNPSTRRHVVKESTPMDTIAAFAASKMGGTLKPMNDGLAYAKATGRPYIFMDVHTGRFFDEAGVTVTEKKPGTVVVKVDTKAKD